MSKEKITFYTAYNFPKPKFDSHGSSKVVKFKLGFLSNGRREKVYHSEYDQNEFIASFADSCDLRTMLQKYVNGDATALGVPSGAYGDVSKMPADLLESYSRTKILAKAFNDLNPELKSQLGSFENFEKFILDPKSVKISMPEATSQASNSESEVK